MIRTDNAVNNGLLSRSECVMEGPLLKRCSDSNKWLPRYFKLYQVRSTSDYLVMTDLGLQNLLFYYDSDQSSRPSGVIFLEVEL